MHATRPARQGRPDADPRPFFIRTDEVAAMLDMTAQHFLARRARLEADAMFPLPMPHVQRPLRWRRDMVEAWIEEQGRPRAPAPVLPPQGGNVVLLERARRL